MGEVQYYYLKVKKLSDDHKRHISDGMKKKYAETGGMTAEHRRHISDGMKRTWKIWKLYWSDLGG